MQSSARLELVLHSSGEEPAGAEKDSEGSFWGATGSTLPQRYYWQKQWRLPGTPWILSGHSRAMERTGFHLRGGSGHILLDAGVDLPSPHSTPPRIVLVSHAHHDHANALPMILRKRHLAPNIQKATHIFVPLQILRRVRDYCLIGVQMQHDARRNDDPLQANSIDPSAIIPGAALCNNVLEGQFRLWRPIVPGMTVPVAMGRAAGREVIEVTAVRCDHTVPTCGYVLAERRRRLDPQYVRETKALTEANVKAAKKRGEKVDIIIRLPLLAFLLDTTPQVLEHSVTQSDLIFSCPVIMIECTYLGQDMAEDARMRRHTMWDGRRPLRPGQFPSRPPGQDFSFY